MKQGTKVLVAAVAVGALGVIAYRVYKEKHPYSDGDSVMVYADRIIPDAAASLPISSLATPLQGTVFGGSVLRVDNINLAGGSSRGVVMWGNVPYAVTFPEAAIYSKAFT